MSDELENSNIVFDKPIVVVSIGHTYLAQGADTIKLPIDLYNQLKEKGVHLNSNGTVSEFWLFDYISSKVRQLINLSGTVSCMSANRYGYFSDKEKMPSDSYICGNRKTSPSGATEAVKAWNKLTGQDRVCAYIELHFDGAGTSRRSFIWCSDYSVNRTLSDGKQVKSNKEGYRLAMLLRKGFQKAIPGWTAHSDVSSSLCGPGIASDSDHLGSQQKNGSAMWTGLRGTDSVGCLVELFNGESQEDAIQALSNIDNICLELAASFIEYASGKQVKFTDEQLLTASYIRTVDNASGLEPVYSDEQKKQIALETQNNLTPIERRMGEGGDKYSISLRNSVEVIGTKPSLTAPYRKYNKNGIKKPTLRTGGVVYDQKVISGYEKIDRDIPTGNKTISAAGTYTINAGDLNLASRGNVDITSGGILSIGSSTQLSLGSQDNLLLSAQNAIVSANNFSISGNTTIDGNISVSGGILTSGATYFGGGVSAPSFNGQYVIDSTNSHELIGYLAKEVIKLILEGTLNVISDTPGSGIIPGVPFNLMIQPASDVKITDVDSGIVGDAGNGFIKIPAHNHQFKRLAGTLASDLTQVQDAVSGILNN